MVADTPCTDAAVGIKNKQPDRTCPCDGAAACRRERSRLLYYYYYYYTNVVRACALSRKFDGVVDAAHTIRVL